MKPESIGHYKILEQSLDDLIKIYRHLLGVVRRERDILITANLEDLNENNKAKEVMLIKARQAEEVRIQAARQLAKSENINTDTRLLEFALHFGGEDGERLRSMHSVLELLLRRVKEHNIQNEILVNSALEKVTGAMGSIRDLLKDKPTYKKTGGITSRPTESGQLVRKEA